MCQTRRGEIKRSLPESGVDAFLNKFSTSNEKRFSSKLICFQLNSSLSPLCQGRRGEVKRPLPEAGVDAFLDLSRHLFIDAAIYK